MQPQYIYEVHTTDGERSSVRSSDDGASGSPGSDDRERARLEQKIYTVRERLKNINLEREHDVEEFLSTTKESEAQRGADNPQMARLKQHFERKNKRQKNDLEHLQKKLAGYEQRLFELDNGCALDTSGRSNVISTVGQGIRRTGANLKEMTESVIAAPLELAHKLKNTFGSADNVNESEFSRYCIIHESTAKT
uniref:V-SNARE domain-containing protein n=1 Tax=Heterorhabditis bacteriophora TaxID=37862 RepID=A0A1I7XUX7_HETBA